MHFPYLFLFRTDLSWEKGKERPYNYKRHKDEFRNAGRHISNLELLLFPIVDGDHLFLVAIDMRGRQPWLLDAVRDESYRGVDPRGDLLYGDLLYFKKEMNVVHQWMKDEVLDKCGRKVLDTKGLDCWDFKTDLPFVPRQQDDDSCCVFAISTADYLERDEIPNCTEANDAVLRERMQLFLMNGKLLE